MSAADPKYLTTVSTAKTEVIKLYTNQRIREVRPVNKEDDPNSLRRAMSFFMLMAQCFGLCPVQGITGLTAQDLRYVRFVIFGPTVLYFTDYDYDRPWKYSIILTPIKNYRKSRVPM
jgi:hypothetical protein